MPTLAAGRKLTVVWLGAGVAFAACYPSYRPPALTVPQAEINVVRVPHPLLCIDGRYFVPSGSEVYKAMRVPAGKPIGVRARLSGYTRCSPGVAFTPRAGASYDLDFKSDYKAGLCSLEVHDENPPPSGLTGPLVVYSSLNDLDDMKCEAD